MLSSKGLKEIVTAARPIIERQLDDAEQIAAFRDKVADAGGDWSALKALIKAQIQDERDETGEGKRVKKILDKAGFSTDYAELLGWSNMNEKNFSAEERIDPLTGEFLDDEPVTIIDQTDADGHHIKVTVDPEIAAILARADGGANIVTKHTEIATNEGGANQPDDAAQGSTPDLEPSGPDVNGQPNSPETADEMDRDEMRGGEAVHSVPAEKGREAIPAGPEGVDLTHAEASESPVPSFLRKPTTPLRPYCRNPGETCGGSGRNHCHSCTKAMREQEELA